MQRFVDDRTGEVIYEGRSFQVGIYDGSEPVEARDYVNIDDALAVMREALTADRPRPPLQIVVRTWEHGKPIKASWKVQE
jgi:hypothetical protein